MGLNIFFICLKVGYVKVFGSRLLQTINVGMKSALALVLPTLQVQIKSPHLHLSFEQCSLPLKRGDDYKMLSSPELGLQIFNCNLFLRDTFFKWEGKKQWCSLRLFLQTLSKMATYQS